jgi:hypothetical protein
LLDAGGAFFATSVLTKDEGPGTPSLDNLERTSAESHQDAWLRSATRHPQGARAAGRTSRESPRSEWMPTPAVLVCFAASARSSPPQSTLRVSGRASAHPPLLAIIRV